ncbi:MAG: metalloregulator ArsR/SmtB family transcription factor [Pyrinomonadaceae bacterium]
MKKTVNHQKMTPEALEMVAERFRLLGEPIRLRILQSLQAGELSVGEITQVVETSQPNVSKHLKMLQTLGVVARRQEGNTVYYSILDPSIFELCDLVCGSIQARLSSQYDRLQSAFG